MKQILGCMKPYRKTIVFSVLFMIVDVLAEIMQPMLMAKIVGRGILSGDLAQIIYIGLFMVGLAAVSMATGVGNSICSAKAGVGFGGALRELLFNKVQSFSFKNIDAFSTASLSTRLTNDVTLLQNTAIMGMRILIRAPLMLVFAVFMALQMSLSLSAVLVVVTPILVIAVYLIVGRAMPLFSKMQSALDNVNRGVQENVTNVRVVKSFVRESFEKEKFQRINGELMEASLRAMNLVIINMPLMMLLMNGSILAVLMIGGRKIISGSLDVATMSAFINYITMILMSLMMISMVFIMLTRASASYKRIREVLSEEVDLVDAPGAFTATTDLKGKVVFKDVSFGYGDGPEETVLTHISFTAEPGSVVAIIGGTGAGKSSLVQLIPRLYDVTEGLVLIDDRDVREYDTLYLRSQIGMVLQKNTLFTGTIRDNLKWGNETASDAEVVEAAKSAQAHEFIMGFQDGYDTLIDQGGVNVSGGQKQRLCIARAMLKKPAILILDDSTSAVDTATEGRIRQAFDKTLSHSTTFIIAQRISSVQEADLILVMDDGYIVARGDHETLLKESEEYREIYESQIGKEANV